MILWSVERARGHARRAEGDVPRAPASDGEPCDGTYMCESNVCDGAEAAAACRAARSRSRCSTTAGSTTRCSRSRAVATRASSARRTPTRSSCRPTARSRTRRSSRRWPRCAASCPSSARRRRRARCRPRTSELKKAKEPISPDGKLYDTDARDLRPEEDGAVPRHPVLVGVRMMLFTQREARRIIRKAVERVPEGEEIRHLNIMPMMDMMTILLVAFIFQAATSAHRAHRRHGRAAAHARPMTPLPEGACDADHHEERHRRRGQVDRLGRATATSTPAEKEGGSLGHQDPAADELPRRAPRRKQLKRRRQPGYDPAKAPPPELLIIADRTTPVPPAPRGDVLGEAEGSRLQALPTDRPEVVPASSRRSSAARRLRRAAGLAAARCAIVAS